MKTILTQLSGSGFSAGTAFVMVIFVVVVSVGIFLLIRSIVLWYWKVDIIVENQDKQLHQLQKIVALLEKSPSTKANDSNVS